MAKYIYIDKHLQIILKKKRDIKVKELLGKVYLYGDWSTHERNLVYKSIDTTSAFNYFAINKEGNITCLDTKKHDQTFKNNLIEEIPERQVIKMGKFLSIIKQYVSVRDGYGDLVTDGEAKEALVNRYTELVIEDCKAYNNPIEPLFHDKPSVIYKTPNSDNAGHYLANSCMRYGGTHHCHNYPEFYDYVSKILYNVDEKGKLLYRALLWELVDKNTNTPFTFLDRVYGCETTHAKLINYAKEKGWAWRNQESSSRTIYDASGKEILCAEIPITKEALDFLRKKGNPYVDTLHYIDFTMPTLSNKPISMESNSLACTSGQAIIGKYKYKCQECGEKSDEESDFIKTENGRVCHHCFKAEGYTKCVQCGEFEKIHYGTAIGIDFYCSTTCAQNAGYVQCNDCENWHTKSTSHMINHMNICSECVSEYAQCEVCGTYHLTEQITVLATNSDSLTICKTCIDKLERCHTCNEILGANKQKVGQFTYCKEHATEAMFRYDSFIIPIEN